MKAVERRAVLPGVFCMRTRRISTFPSCDLQRQSAGGPGHHEARRLARRLLPARRGFCVTMWTTTSTDSQPVGPACPLRPAARRADRDLPVLRVATWQTFVPSGTPGRPRCEILTCAPIVGWLVTASRHEGCQRPCSASCQRLGRHFASLFRPLLRRREQRPEAERGVVSFRQPRVA